jgi:hypothetical protein
MAGVCRVLFYLEDSKAGKQKLCEIQNALADYHVSVRKVRDEDWKTTGATITSRLRLATTYSLSPAAGGAERTPAGRFCVSIPD